jgi:hypothetical protein
VTDPSSWLVACDLDQTLIYSRNAFRLPADAAPPALRTVEYLRGEPLSYVTEPAADGLRRLAQLATLVPVTTRTLEQYRRVDLGTRSEYAIAANGGHLLVGGAPDPDWDECVRARLAAAGRPLEEIRTAAEALAASDDWVRTIRDADGFFVYLVATERRAIPDLSALAASLADDGWTLSVQGRKVYFVPAVLTKEAALADVVRRTATTKLAAAGDSLLDRGMLAAADVAIRPAHGELHDQGFGHPRLCVAAQSGILAGEEIVQFLAAVVSGSESAAPSAVAPSVRTSTFPVGAG